MADDYGKVEAVLFAAGKSLSITDIMEHSGILHRKKVLTILAKIKEDYDQRDSALRVFEEGENWKLTVGEKYTPTVRRIMPHTELSKTLMETLAVIAWKAPVLQSKVIAIRTNKAYDHIDELERLQFLTKQKYGRTYIIRLTSKFFDYFDVSNEKEVHDMFKDFQAKDAVKIKYAPAIEVVDMSLPSDAPLQQQFISDDSIKLFEKLGQLEVYNLDKKQEGEELPEEKEEAAEEKPELPQEEESPEKKKSDAEFEDRWKQFEQKVQKQDEEEEKQQEQKQEQPSPEVNDVQKADEPKEEKKESVSDSEAVDILSPKREYDDDEEEKKEPIPDEKDEEKKESDPEKKKRDLSEHILKNFDLGF